MPRILLVNFDEEQARRMAAFLRTERQQVCVAPATENVSQTVRRICGIDLVILDASHREKYARDLLNGIASYRARNGPRPMVLCISRVYRGPRFQLDVERKGARLIYVE
jgi:DNA-binding response OmpR family regulator